MALPAIVGYGFVIAVGVIGGIWGTMKLMNPENSSPPLDKPKLTWSSIVSTVSEWLGLNRTVTNIVLAIAIGVLLYFLLSRWMGKNKSGSGVGVVNVYTGQTIKGNYQPRAKAVNNPYNTLILVLAGFVLVYIIYTQVGFSGSLLTYGIIALVAVALYFIFTKYIKNTRTYYMRKG